MLRLISVVIAMLVVTADVAAQAPSSPAAFVPPDMQGRAIDVGGRQLHMHCTGNSGPSVIIESALGMWTSHYSVLQEHIARFGRVCTYDRAGLGWSDPASAGRSIDDMANDLERVVQASELPAPYILVGHSLGGLIVRRYASKHAAEVAGVVLVESSNELINFTTAYQTSRIQRIAMIDSGLKIGKPGIPVMPMPAGSAPETIMAMLPETLLATKDELASFERTPESMRSSGGFGTLGEIPLIVIRRGRTAQPPSADDNAWRDSQIALSNLSTNSEVVVAKNSGHMVHIDEPAVVAAAVERVWKISR
jgi:pimeloyl-ACP methyl ester carboxylesterase